MGRLVVVPVVHFRRSEAWLGRQVGQSVGIVVELGRVQEGVLLKMGRVSMAKLGSRRVGRVRRRHGSHQRHGGGCWRKMSDCEGSLSGLVGLGVVEEKLSSRENRARVSGLTLLVCVGIIWG